jgi:hypothetical protein
MHQVPSRIARGDRLSDDAVCVMQAVAQLAGEPRTDHPICCSSLLTEFAISLNDAIQDDGRRTQLLRPLVPMLVDTRASAQVDLVRSYMALDWLVREYVPAWLDLVPALRVVAARLRSVSAIRGPAGFGLGVRLLLARARDEARAAAREGSQRAPWADAPDDSPAAIAKTAALAAAWAAARDASGDAVRDSARWSGQPAAWTAAWTAAEHAAHDASTRSARAEALSAMRGTAGDAAWAAANDAAGDAVRAAVRDAATDAAWAAVATVAGEAAHDAVDRVIGPTVAALHASAADLLRRMCTVIYFA